MRGGFEKGALIAGRLPDGFDFAQPIKPGEVEGIALIVLVGMGTDQAIVPRIADRQLRDVRLEQLAEPARQIGFLQHEPFVGRSDEADLLDECIGAGGQPPPLLLRPVVIELGQHTIFGVGIQPDPCY